MGVTKRGHRPPQGQVLPLHQPHLEPKTPNGGAKGGAPHQVPLSSSGDAPGSGAGGVWVPWGGCSPTQPPDPSASEGCQPPYPHHPTGAGKHKRAWGGHPHVPPSPPIIAPRARGTGGTQRLLRPNPGFPWGQGPPARSQGWGGSVSPRVALLHVQVTLSLCHSRRHVDVPVPLLPAHRGHRAARSGGLPAGPVAKDEGGGHSCHPGVPISVLAVTCIVCRASCSPAAGDSGLCHGQGLGATRAPCTPPPL